MADQTVKIRLEGWRELDSRLKTLSPKIERSVFRKALRSTGNKINRKIKKGTPVRALGGGAAKKSVKTKVSVKRGGAYARIGYTGLPTFYMRIYETGRIISGGQPARPFFDAALGPWRENASDDFAKALRREVDKVA